MTMYSDHGALNDAEPASTELELEATRLAFVTARVRVLERMELELLVLAVNTPDDETARRLELVADGAWRDALALNGEHELVHSYWPEEEDAR
jgi:hypothetical protein